MAPFARLRDVVPSAYLRVFQPLDGFEREEQIHWERYLIEGARSTTLRRRYADHETTPGLGVLAPAEGEHAEIRVIDGRTFVSPWRMHLRVLAALLSFSATKPLELSDRFVPKQDVKRAAKELAKLRRSDPGAVAFVVLELRFPAARGKGPDVPKKGDREWGWGSPPDQRRRGRIPSRGVAFQLLERRTSRPDGEAVNEQWL
jgi:hypothetical protein